MRDLKFALPNAWLLGLCGAELVLVCHGAIPTPPRNSPPLQPSPLAQLPLSFEKNQGQVKGSTEFLARGPGYTFFLSGSESVLQLRETAITTRLLCSNPRPRVQGSQKLRGRVNYFLGNDPKQWRTNVPLFGRVRCEEVYPGIDAVYYGTPGELEYDFVVRPGADPADIRLQIEGAESAVVDASGDLVLHTPGGDLRQKRPLVYQEKAGKRRTIEGDYVVAAATGAAGPFPEITFRLGDYDPRQTLIIDPVVTYSTFFGSDGSTGLTNANMTADEEGNAYLTGDVDGVLPVTPGAIQHQENGFSDLYVAKIATDASGPDSLIFCTYLGGSLWDDVSRRAAIELGPDGSIYLSGSTASADFPTTPGAYDRAPNQFVANGYPDAFVARIDPSGSALIYSTLIGGNGADTLGGLGVDAQGCAYLGTWHDLSSGEFTPTPGAYNVSGESRVTKIAADGKSLVYSLRYGAGPSTVSLEGLAIDEAGAVYTCGYTADPDFPTTPGAYLRVPHPGGSYYVSKFSPDGSTLLHSTFLHENVAPYFLDSRIAVGPGGRVYLTGQVSQSGHPVTPTAFQLEAPQGPQPTHPVAFLTVFDPTLSSLEYSTCYGGPTWTLAMDIMVDPQGLAYLSGMTNNPGPPLKNPIKGAFNPPNEHADAWFAIFDPSKAGNDSLVFATLWGGGFTGMAGEWGCAIDVDANKNIYLAGYVYAPDYPVTTNAYLPIKPPGGPHMYLTRFSPAPPPAAPSQLRLLESGRTTVDLAWNDNSDTETGFRIERRTGSDGYAQVGSVPANTTAYRDTGLNPSTVYAYRVRAGGEGAHSGYSNSVEVSTGPEPPVPAGGLTAQLTGFATATLTWQDNSGNEAGFRVERSTNNFNTVTSAVVLPNQTSYVDTGLARNTLYAFRVVAFTRSPGGAQADASPSGSTNLLTAPHAPAGVSITSLSTSELRVSWTNGNSSGGPTSFELFRSSDGGESYPASPTATVTGIVPGGAGQHVDTGLAPNTRYVYRLRALTMPPAGATGGGPSELTDPTAQYTRPAAAQGLAAAVIAPTTGVRLTWTDPNLGGAGSRIERSTDGFQQSVQVAGTVPVGTSGFDDTAALGNTLYHYRVVTSNLGGDGTPSGTAERLTLPGVPGSITVTASADGSPRRGRTQLDLSWSTGGTGTTTTRIERSTNGGETFDLLAQVPAPGAAFTDTSLTEDTPYLYRLQAANASGAGVFSEAVGGRTLKAPPAAPAGLTVAPSGQGALDLNWNNSPRTEGLRIERRRSGEASFTLRATLSAETSSYRDAGLLPATFYAYRLIAYNNGGDSDPPASGSATTLPAPPSTPTALSILIPAAPAGQTQLNVSWTDSSTNEDSFLLERSTDSGANWAPFPLVASTSQAGTGSRITFPATGLSPGTTYRYRVAAVNTGGQSAWLGPAVSTTQPPAADAPTGLSAAVPPAPLGQTRVNLTWTDASGTETGFAYQFSGDNGATWSANAAVATPSTPGIGATVSAEIAGLTAGKTYLFRVGAVNAGGVSDWAGPVSATTLPAPPSAPSGTIVTTPARPGGLTSLLLQWTDNSSNETWFKIERRTGVEPFQQIAAVGAGVTSYSDTPLAPGTTYTYQVLATNSGGDSAYSPAAQGSTLPAPPVSPAGLKVSVPPAPEGRSRLTLNWQDTSNNETGFSIERRTGAAAFQSVGSTAAGTTTYTDTDLGTATTYEYRVQAFNPGGESDPSAVAGATTLPAPPSTPTALQVSTPPAPDGVTSLTLSWGDAATGEIGYYIERQTAGGSFTRIGETGPNFTAYTDPNCSGGTTYTYRVQAFNAGGGSDYAGPVQGSTLPHPPSAPELTRVATVSTTELRLEWTHSGSGVAGFKVERGTAGTGFGLVATLDSAPRSWNDTGLQPGTSYLYRVRAFNAGGNSPTSQVVSGTTLARFTIRGTVRFNGAGLAGVSIRAGTASTTTAGDGSYTLSNLPPGSYTVTAQRVPFVFEPASQPAAVGPNREAVDFIALSPFTLSLATASTRGGKAVRGTVTFRSAVTAPTKVTLTSGNPTAAKVPASVTVAKRGQAKSFSITTRRVTAPTVVTVTATLSGVSQTVTLTVLPR